MIDSIIFVIRREFQKVFAYSSDIQILISRYNVCWNTFWMHDGQLPPDDNEPHDCRMYHRQSCRLPATTARSTSLFAANTLSSSGQQIVCIIFAWFCGIELSPRDAWSGVKQKKIAKDNPKLWQNNARVLSELTNQIHS